MTGIGVPKMNKLEQIVEAKKIVKQIKNDKQFMLASKFPTIRNQKSNIKKILTDYEKKKKMKLPRLFKKTLIEELKKMGY